MSSKIIKKQKPLKEEVVHNQKCRDYAQKKLEVDLKTYESRIKKLEESINNYEQEMTQKKELLKEHKKQLEELKFIQSNLPLVTV